MDVSTTNTIISSAAAVIGSLGLFALGAILSYVRGINKGMKRIEEMTVRHDVKIEQLEKGYNSLLRNTYHKQPPR